MKKIIVLIGLFLIENTLLAQAEFKVKVLDFLWLDYKVYNEIELLILLEVKNVGSSEEKCNDLYSMNLRCSNKFYEYGRQLKFVSISSEVEEYISPQGSKTLYIIFSVPKDADNLTLYFTSDAGGDNRYLTESFNKWVKNNRNYNKFIDEGDNAFTNKDYVTSIVNYSKALLINSKAQLNFQLGNSWMMIGNYDQAIEYYKQSFNEVKDKSIVYNNLGYAYFEKGYYNDAVDNFGEAYDRDNKHWDAVLGAAISYYELNDLYSAEYYYKMAANIENLLYRGMEGLEKLLSEGYFYTEKQINSINNLCKYLGYTSY